MEFCSLCSEVMRDRHGPHHIHHWWLGGRAGPRTSSELYLPLLHRDDLEQRGQGSGVGQEGSAAEDGVSTASREESWNWVMSSGFCPPWVGGYSGERVALITQARTREWGWGRGGRRGVEKRGEGCPVTSYTLTVATFRPVLSYPFSPHSFLLLGSLSRMPRGTPCWSPRRLSGQSNCQSKLTITVI